MTSSHGLTRVVERPRPSPAKRTCGVNQNQLGEGRRIVGEPAKKLNQNQLSVWQRIDPDVDQVKS